MRSNLVFRASDKISNRFELCLLASRSARAMNHSGAQMHDAINNAFDAIGKHVEGNASLDADANRIEPAVTEPDALPSEVSVPKQD